MKIKAANTKDAFDLIQKFDLPLEIEIPRGARIAQFIGGIRFYAYRSKLILSLINASTEDAQIIYVADKTTIDIKQRKEEKAEAVKLRDLEYIEMITKLIPRQSGYKRNVLQNALKRLYGGGELGHNIRVMIDRMAAR